jgi:hypothetical protein
MDPIFSFSFVQGILLTAGVLIARLVFGRILALLFTRTRCEVLVFDCDLYGNNAENAMNDRELLEELLVGTQLAEERNGSKERHFEWIDGHSESENFGSMHKFENT